MLQLNVILRNATVRIIPLSPWRISTQQFLAASSRAVSANPILTQAKEEIKSSTSESKTTRITKIKSENPLIQAAFKNLEGTNTGPLVEIRDGPIMMKIKAAENIENLLNIANIKNITRQNAFAIVSLLVDWVNAGKAKLKDFETDKRFLYLCTLLSQPENEPKSDESKVDRRQTKLMNRLNLFYNINEINEASKEVANLPLPQMIKVMSGLANQRRRSPPLLRALSFNISRSTNQLDIKELSDLLYSMSVLNFPDEVLLERVSGDLIDCVPGVPRSSVIGSIIRSLGSLRFKKEELLDKLSDWVIDHMQETRPQDMCSLFVTLAVVNYTPSNVESLIKVVVDQLKESDMSRPSEWLDFVWALTILQLARDWHIASVLDRSFIEKLMDNADIPVPKKHKLLNINAAAQTLIEGYNGPLLDSDSSVFNVVVLRSKEKEIYVKTVIETLKNIFSFPEYCKTDIDTAMGFLLDAEIRVDPQGNRLPLTCNMNNTNGYRLAVVAQYYHDFTRGKHSLLGFNSFYCRLLETKGYKILSIPHTEFNPEDKTVQRTTYINDRINSITK